MKALLPVMKKVDTVDHVATGRLVRERRMALGMSVREAGAVMGISAPYLCDLERGRRNWSQAAIDRLKLLRKP